jgi:hypothetical protein
VLEEENEGALTCHSNCRLNIQKESINYSKGYQLMQQRGTFSSKK